MRRLRRIAVAAACVWASPSFAEQSAQSFPELSKVGGQTPAASHQYPMCPMNEPAKTKVSAIDASRQIDERFVEQAARRHVQVIFRYYDWPSVPGETWNDSTNSIKSKSCFRDPTAFNSRFDLPWKSGETIPGKTLTSRERDLILSKNLAIGTVFQHCNNRFETFKDSKRAAFDAQRALDLAKDLGQPRGTAIFFTVDLEIKPERLKPVRDYIATVQKKVEAAGYILGIYGNGLICSTFASTVKYCWLSQSTGHTGSKAYAAARKWDILQCLPRDPFSTGGPDFDLDIFNARKPPIPFWTGARSK